MEKYKPITKEIVKIAFPMAFQALLIWSLQLADNLFIGHLPSAVFVAAGVNAINNMTFIIGSLVTGLIAGIGIYFTQVSARGDQGLQHKVFKAKIFWMVITSFILISVFTGALKPIASLWVANNGDKAETLDYAFKYGVVVIPSVFLDFVITLFANSFKEVKKVKVAVAIAILALIINAVFNYVFMYVLRLGVSGSAYATLLARGIEIIVWFIYITKTKPDFIPKFLTWLSIDWKTTFRVFPKSAMWTINSFLLSLAFTLQILFMSRISSDSGASLNSAGVFLQLMYAFTNGFMQAISILIVSHLAKKTMEEMHRYLFKSVVISAIFGVIACVTIVLLSPMMFVLYSKYSYQTNVESLKMIVAVGIMIPFSLANGVVISALKGAGFAKSLIVVDALISWIISLPLTIVLTHVDAGLSYGEIYMIVSFTSIIKTPIIFHLYKKLKYQLKPLNI